MTDERDGADPSHDVPAEPAEPAAEPVAERVPVLARARALWCQLVSGLG